MRGLMILADRHYVTSGDINYDPTSDSYFADLATGGKALVPRDRLVAFELYTTDGEIEHIFRPRLAELEAAAG